MFELAKKVNAYKAEIGEGKPDGKLVDKMQKVFAEMCSIIGILETKEGTADKIATPKETDPEAAEIEAAIAKRAEAKKNKDYKLADQIRAELAAKGITLQDTPQGVKWTRE